eukprot:scaffold3436_cov66-Cylindrotheca_fusiformis.AAC.4
MTTRSRSTATLKALGSGSPATSTTTTSSTCSSAPDLASNVMVVVGALNTTTTNDRNEDDDEMDNLAIPPTLHRKKQQLLQQANSSNKSRWVRCIGRLLAAPTVALLLSIFATSRYVTLIIVFALTSIKPLRYCYKTTIRKNNNNNNSSSFDMDTMEQLVSATLQMQKAMMAQFAVLASFIWVYHKTTFACGGDRNVHEAFGNAKTIIEVEQFLHVDVEPAWQRAALPYPYAMTFFNQYYARTHFVVPILTAGYLLATKQDTVYFYRGSFALALVLALIGYMYVPTMPPRLLRRYANTYTTTVVNSSSMQEWLGMIDSLRESHSTYDTLHSAMGNPYAAMPSMHTGWATWSCLSVWDVTTATTKGGKRRRHAVFWRVLLVLHVLTIMYSTIVTANHYVLDLAAGILCVLLGRLGMKWILFYTTTTKQQQRRRRLKNDDEETAIIVGTLPQ